MLWRLQNQTPKEVRLATATGPSAGSMSFSCLVMGLGVGEEGDGERGELGYTSVSCINMMGWVWLGWCVWVLDYDWVMIG
jgi:hypothetical protein